MFNILRYFWDNYKNYLILILFVTLSVSLLTLNDNPRVKNFRSFSFGLFSATTSFFQPLFNFNNIQSENTELRDKNAQLMLELNRLREYRRVADDIDSMKIQADTFSTQTVFSKIIFRAYSGNQLNLNIDAGRNEGIEAGMPVITPDGLAGIVYESSNEYSIVRTIKNSNLRLVVRNSGDGSQGILRWNGRDLLITNLPKTAVVNIGDVFVTSDVSSLVNLPVNIGYVKKVLNPEEGIFNDILLKSAVNVDQIDYVFVVKEIPSKIKRNVELNFYRYK